MSIVVSDTSPTRALDHLGLLGLIEKYYGEVIVPPAVAKELCTPRHGFKLIDVTQLGFVRVVAPTQAGPDLPDLDRGEVEAIALALEVQADYLLIDEAAGRSAAGNLGLKIVGTLGVLVRAKEVGEISALASLLDTLKNELRFFISPQVRRAVSNLVHEECGSSSQRMDDSDDL